MDNMDVRVVETLLDIERAYFSAGFAAGLALSKLEGLVDTDAIEEDAFLAFKRVCYQRSA
jgi:hypothetical protein